jgi:hypothetical protein
LYITNVPGLALYGNIRVHEESPQGDEYHSMDELYRYRMLYNAIAANAMPEISCKSKRHSDGEPCFDGEYFIVVMSLPTGQVSNHYKLEFWDLFNIPEVETPPEYDGHTPGTAALRMQSYLLALAHKYPAVRIERDEPIEEVRE